MYYLTVEDKFSSAHQLNGYKGKCENLHGHNWRVIATIKGIELNSIGLLMDFNDLKKYLKEILNGLDHTLINQIPYFMEINPSSENIAKYIFDKLNNDFQNDGIKNAAVDSITVYESDTSRCLYTE